MLCSAAAVSPPSSKMPNSFFSFGASSKSSSDLVTIFSPSLNSSLPSLSPIYL
jgi:hypothetical protein